MFENNNINYILVINKNKIYYKSFINKIIKKKKKEILVI